MMCNGCPFNDTEEAVSAQNLGCLPTPQDMVNILDRQGIALSCHDREDEPCHGLGRVRNVQGAEVLAYSKWYREGV